MVGPIDACTCPGEDFPAEELLRQMDASGIERAVIGPTPAEMAVSNLQGNVRLQGEWKRHPDRFIPSCTATPWRAREAVEIVQLSADAGVRMLVLAPAVQGFNLTEPLADLLLEAAAEWNMTVYVHTGPHSFGAPSQVALAALKHPATQFILGHCGSTDHAWDMPAIAEHHLGPNLFLETSLVRPWAVPRLLELAGPERVLFGTAAPTNDMRFETSYLLDVVPAENHPGFYGENLLRVLGEVRAC